MVQISSNIYRNPNILPDFLNNNLQLIDNQKFIMGNFSSEREKIVSLLKTNGYSQASFSTKIGMNPKTFSLNVNKSTIDFVFRNQILEGLGVSQKEYDKFGEIEPEKDSTIQIIKAKDELIATQGEFIHSLKKQIELLENKNK